MQRTPILVVALSALVAAALAKEKPQLTVEVVKAETVHRSAGTTKTDCDLNDATASCTSATQRVVPTERVPVLYQVNLLVKMPDGSTVAAQCRRTTSLISMMTPCVQPEPGIYPAKIDKHDLRLLIPVMAKPEYSKDGTLQKAAKAGTQEVKFSYR